MFDVDKSTKLNPLEYDSLNELIGKHIKLIIELKKASDLPEKYTYKIMCKYIYNEAGFETIVVEKQRSQILIIMGNICK